MISDYIDEWGLLDKKRNKDGGDTCQREGMYFCLLWWVGMRVYHDRFATVMSKLHPHPGVLLRHSNPNYDASDWDRMSRDQIQAMVIAMGYWSKDELKKFTKGHAKRAFIFANNTRQNGATKRNHGSKGRSYAWKFPDITGPEIWGNLIRAFNAWYLYPLLCVLDCLELVWGAVAWRIGKKHNIALNQTLSQMQSYDRLPTPASWLANKIMPIPKMIEICKDHLDDPYVEMPFFGEMFDKAWANISQGK